VHVVGLMNAADYYGLDELRKSCAGFVQCCINVDTVCALLASAERYIQYKCTKSLVQKVTNDYSNITVHNDSNSNISAHFCFVSNMG
jgi:hypothetical protein